MGTNTWNLTFTWRKAHLVTTKKNWFCYKSFQHSAFLNLLDEYSYIFFPEQSTPGPFQRKRKKKKKRGEQKDWNALETYCYPWLPDTLIWRILPITLILDSELLLLTIQLCIDLRAHLEKKKKNIHTGTHPVTSN